MIERARCAWLVRKAAPGVPPWVRDRIDSRRAAPGPPPLPESVPPAPAGVDPLDRLEKLGSLRERVLTEPQFEAQRARILADPGIAAFGAAEGVEPLDRLARVGALQEAGVLTADQGARLTEQILDAG